MARMRANSRYMDDDGNLIPVNHQLMEVMESRDFTSQKKVSYADAKQGADKFEAFALKYHVPVFTTAQEVEKRYMQMYDLILANSAQNAQKASSNKKKTAQQSAEALRKRKPTNTVTPFGNPNSATNDSSQSNPSAPSETPSSESEISGEQTQNESNNVSVNSGASETNSKSAQTSPIESTEAKNETDATPSANETPNDVTGDADTPPTTPLSGVSETPASDAGGSIGDASGGKLINAKPPFGDAESDNPTSGSEEGAGSESGSEDSQSEPEPQIPQRRTTPAGVSFGNNKEETPEETPEQKAAAARQRAIERGKNRQTQEKAEAAQANEFGETASQEPAKDNSDLTLDGLLDASDVSQKNQSKDFDKLFAHTHGIQSMGPLTYNSLLVDDNKVTAKVESAYVDTLRTTLMHIFNSGLAAEILNNLSYPDVIYSNTIYMNVAAGYLSLMDYRKYCVAKALYWIGKKHKRVEHFKTYKTVSQAVKDDSDDNLMPVQARWYLLMSQLDPHPLANSDASQAVSGGISEKMFNERMDELLYEMFRVRSIDEAILTTQYNGDEKGVKNALFGTAVKKVRVFVNKYELELIKPKITMRRTNINRMKFKRNK